MTTQKWFMPKAGLDRGDPALKVGGQVRLNCRTIASGITAKGSVLRDAGFETYGDMTGELVTLNRCVYVGTHSDDWEVEFSCGGVKQFSTLFFMEAHLPYLHPGCKFLFRPPTERWGDQPSGWLRKMGAKTYGEADGFPGEIIQKLNFGTQDRQIWQCRLDGTETITSWYDTWMEPIGGGKAPSRCRCELWIGACHCGGARAELDETMAAQDKYWCRWTRLYVKKK